jgi:hypothetical protein
MELMPHAGRRPRLAAILLLALLAGASSACVTRTSRQTVFVQGQTEVILRSQKKGGRAIDRGFEHPVTIAPVRVSHILSRIDMREKNGKDSKRVPAIPLETLFVIAEGIAEGLQAADSSQEVVVQSVRRGKHLGIFDRHYLTSLLCYMMDGRLYIHVSRADWEIPVRRDRDRLPETHVGEHPLKFRLLVDRGMSLVDEQAVAVDWRDTIFKKPTRTRMTPGGKVVRRTILMETMEDDTDYGPNPTVSEELTPKQLRALADLEDARLRGEVSESEYSARRNQILRGEADAP